MARLRNTYDDYGDTEYAVPRDSYANEGGYSSGSQDRTEPYQAPGIVAGEDTKSNSGYNQGETFNPTYQFIGPGFEASKYGKDDPKYVFAKYAGNYDFAHMDQGGYDQLLKQLREDPSGYFKNASFDKDILHGAYDPETGRYGDVDVMKGYDAGGQGWQWGAIPESVGKQSYPTGGGNLPYPPGGGSSGAPGGGGGGYAPPKWSGDIMAELAKLFPNGAFNQDLVNHRVANASDALSRNRKSQLANTEAILASRGQGRNDGTFGTSLGNLEERLGQDYNAAVNDIFSNESAAADQRMISALQMATGLTESEARNAVDMARIASEERIGQGNIGLGYYNADINKTLGLGNLALGNARLSSDYNLGLGQLGLGRDVAKNNMENARYDRLIALLNSGVSLDQIIANGWI